MRPFFCSFVLLCSVLLAMVACSPDPHQQRIAELEQQALEECLAQLSTAPCETTLRFEKTTWVWGITCPLCATLPASQFFPKATLEQVERWAINGQLAMIDLLKIRGECP